MGVAGPPLSSPIRISHLLLPSLTMNAKTTGKNIWCQKWLATKYSGKGYSISYVNQLDHIVNKLEKFADFVCLHCVI